MFLWVKKAEKEKCPYCREYLTDNYQTKSSDMHDEWGGCCERHPEPLGLIEKTECDNFYQNCQKCEKWIEYKVVKRRMVLQTNKE